jgi:UDP-N-acetylglucosamine 2-epimerase (non-hydrolysing)
MKVVEIVGARPQFIKAATMWREIRKKDKGVLVHTGQHYDKNLSKIFFDELDIPKPNYNLGVGSGSHGMQTGKMLTKIEDVLIHEDPDMVVVYGDTNSTLAGALSAVKMHIPTAHVEAGLRSFNREMPEEINRVVTDHISDLLFAPTKTAVSNLKKEGVKDGVHLTGDCMYDALLYNKKLSSKSTVVKDLGLEPEGYLVATVHRPSNTDVEKNLKSIITAFSKAPSPVVFPVHPRTRKMIKRFKLNTKNVKMIDPVGYLEFIALQANSDGVVTDSGGIQKEAYLLKRRCITLRNETEWVETVKDGWNTLVGPNQKKILDAMKKFHPKKKHSNPYGDGEAAKKMVKIIKDFHKKKK